MKNIFIIISFLIFLGSLASASAVDDFKGDLDKAVGKEVPGFLKSVFGNERVNIYVDMDDGSQRNLSIKTERGKVTHISADTLNENPTLNVYTSEKTIASIVESDNKVQRTKEAIKSKEIRIEAVKPFGKLKFGAAKFFLGFGVKKSR